MKKLACMLLALLFTGTAAAETRWIACKPDDYVNVREKASKRSAAVGYLESGDEIETDGKVRDGFVHITCFGESGDGWVFAGFISDEEPEEVMERYVCVAHKRVACRRWIDGDRIAGKYGWLNNGSNATVYYRAGEWLITSRGYIRAEWMEPDPAMEEQ